MFMRHLLEGLLCQELSKTCNLSKKSLEIFLRNLSYRLCNNDRMSIKSFNLYCRCGTVDSLFGVTRNVWGYKEEEAMCRISGGSSGGSAVAVASGTCFA